MQKPKRLRHALLGVSLITCTVIPAPVLACETIRFARGEYSTTVSGVAPPEDVVCYQMTTGAGQRARLRITGRNVMFSVEGVMDGQDDLSFVTEKTTYRIVVAQLMRSVTSERFSLYVEVR